MKKELKNIQTFEQYTDKNLNISDVINSSVLDDLLKKRFNYLKKFSDKEQKDGYEGLLNLRIENNKIKFNTNIEDCRYDDKYFYIVGNEGEDKVEIQKENFLKEIKKHARNVNCGGLK